MEKSKTCGEKIMIIKGNSGEIILRKEKPGLLVVELPLTGSSDELQVEEDDPFLY